MELNIADIIGIMLGVFSFGITIGRLVEKINNHISESKNHPFRRKD